MNEVGGSPAVYEDTFVMLVCPDSWMVFFNKRMAYAFFSKNYFCKARIGREVKAVDVAVFNRNSFDEVTYDFYI